MENTSYDPTKSVQKGNGQALNTAGSGAVGTVVAGIVYSLIPATVDDTTRKVIAGGAGAAAGLAVSWLHGWWANRRKHI